LAKTDKTFHGRGVLFWLKQNSFNCCFENCFEAARLQFCFIFTSVVYQERRRWLGAGFVTTSVAFSPTI